MAAFLLRGALIGLDQGAQVERVGSSLDAIALKGLLPVFIYEALAGVGLSADTLLSVSLGIAIPSACLVGAGIYQRWLPHGRFTSSNALELGFLASSFGGGNRGTALLVLLFASAPDFNAYVKAFVLVDLGNFFFLLVAVPWMLTRYLGDSQRAAPYSWISSFLQSYFVFAAVGVLSCYGIAANWEGFSDWLTHTTTVRKSIFTVLVFVALGLRLKFPTAAERRAIQPDLMAFALIRCAGAVLVAGVVWLTAASHYLAVAVAILMLMPPSSLLPVLASQSNVRREALRYFVAFSVVCNLLYMVLIAISGIVLWQAPVSH